MRIAPAPPGLDQEGRVPVEEPAAEVQPHASVLKSVSPLIVDRCCPPAKATTEKTLLQEAADLQFESTISACQEKAIGPAAEESVADEVVSRIRIDQHFVYERANLVRPSSRQP